MIIVRQCCFAVRDHSLYWNGRNQGSVHHVRYLAMVVVREQPGYVNLTVTFDEQKLRVIFPQYTAKLGP